MKGQIVNDHRLAEREQPPDVTAGRSQIFAVVRHANFPVDLLLQHLSGNIHRLRRIVNIEIRFFSELSLIVGQGDYEYYEYYEYCEC